MPRRIEGEPGHRASRLYHPNVAAIRIVTMCRTPLTGRRTRKSSVGAIWSHACDHLAGARGTCQLPLADIHITAYCRGVARAVEIRQHPILRNREIASAVCRWYFIC